MRFSLLIRSYRRLLMLQFRMSVQRMFLLHGNRFRAGVVKGQVRVVLLRHACPLGNAESILFRQACPLGAMDNISDRVHSSRQSRIGPALRALVCLGRNSEVGEVVCNYQHGLRVRSETHQQQHEGPTTAGQRLKILQRIPGTTNFSLHGLRSR
jgi:hypothetical protein